MNRGFFVRLVSRFWSASPSLYRIFTYRARFVLTRLPFRKKRKRKGKERGKKMSIPRGLSNRCPLLNESGLSRKDRTISFVTIGACNVSNQPAAFLPRDCWETDIRLSNLYLSHDVHDLARPKNLRSRSCNRRRDEGRVFSRIGIRAANSRERFSKVIV